MKRYFILVFSILIISLLFCNSKETKQPQTIDNKLSAETEKQLQEIGKKMIDAALSGDLLSTAQYYTDDLVLKPDFNPVIIGKENYIKKLKENMESGVKYNSFNANIEKIWQKGDEIFERGNFAFSVTSKYFNKPKAYIGSYFQIWKLQKDNTFKISYNIWNMDFNPCD